MPKKNMSTSAMHLYSMDDLWVEARHFTQKWSDTTWLSVKAAGHETTIFVPGVAELQQLQAAINYQVNKLMEQEINRIRDEFDAVSEEAEDE